MLFRARRLSWGLLATIGCGDASGDATQGTVSTTDGGSGQGEVSTSNAPTATSEASSTTTDGGSSTTAGATTGGSSSTTGCSNEPAPDLPYTGMISNSDELAALPPRHWATVANSSPNNAEMQPEEWPDFDGSASASYDSYQRVSGFTDLVRGWNSGVAAQVDGLPALLLLGGGHNGYGGNEIIAFDIATLAWSRLIDPTAFPNRSPDFMNPDGTPISRHTYSSLVWVEHRSQLFMLGGAPDSGPGGCGVSGTWLFDPSDASYTLSAADGEPNTGCDNAAAYDPQTGLVYYAGGGGGSGGWTVYDSDNDTWTNSGDSSIANQMNLVIDPVRRRLIAVGGSDAGGIRSFDLDAADLTPSTFLPSGPTDVQNADDPGLVYDPVLDRIVGYNGGASLFALDLDAEAWEELTPDPANLVSPENTAAGGVFGRFRYFPSINAYVYVNATSQDVAIYRATPGDCVDR